ncbi:hypothetical protein NPIL_406811 [Nephila pilipes]|uniref:Uncharacterized protein n=1 Tax=Nephila pilipes TaxID=299642 RepID=A0A8X6NBT4_NEPPI|nr:hypothetical protein NPIL_406811 [Nephila pilipes]
MKKRSSLKAGVGPIKSRPSSLSTNWGKGDVGGKFSEKHFFSNLFLEEMKTSRIMIHVKTDNNAEPPPPVMNMWKCNAKIDLVLPQQFIRGPCTGSYSF